MTFGDVSMEAFTVVANGKAALEWVMDRQAVTTDKDKGIENDANLWPPKRWATPNTRWTSSSA